MPTRENILTDEGIFGDAFFEPIAKIAGKGTVSPIEGVDIAVETDDINKAISVKSGPIFLTPASQNA